MPSIPSLGTTRLLPVTLYQADMLEFSVNPETTDAYHLFFTLQWGIRVKPSVSRRQLKRAFNQLVKRHDSLRLRFHHGAEGWGAEILDDHPTGLQETDLTQATKEDQDLFIESLGQSPIKAHEGPCFQMHLIDCGTEGHAIILSAHHVIIDGYGLVILVEDFLKMMFHMPLTGRGISHAEFAQDIQSRTQHRRDEKDAYWTKRLSPLPPDPIIGRKAKGLPAFTPPMMRTSIRLDGILTPDIMTGIKREQTSSEASVFPLLYAAFADALCEMSQQDDILICSWAGRQEAHLREFVGCDTRMMQQVYRRVDRPLQQKAAQISQSFFDAIEHLPSQFFAQNSPFVADLEAQDRTLWRFQFHNGTPSARLSKSPFSKVLLAGMTDGFSFGPLKIEKLTFPRACDTRFELTVLLNQTGEGQNATMIADSRAFEPSELEWLQEKTRENLRFSLLS